MKHGNGLGLGYLQVHRVTGPVVSLALPAVEFSTELPADGLEMHEVTESRSRALPGLVLATARLAEVRHGRQLGVYRPPSEPAIVQVTARLLGVLRDRKQ